MNTEQISRMVAVTHSPPNNKKKYSFLIGIILSKHALGCNRERRNHLNTLNMPKLSKVWWPGTIIMVVFQAAAKRLILEDVWGVSGGVVPAP